jgi:hypothetical protein
MAPEFDVDVCRVGLEQSRNPKLSDEAAWRSASVSSMSSRGRTSSKSESLDELFHSSLEDDSSLVVDETSCEVDDDDSWGEPDSYSSI